MSIKTKVIDIRVVIKEDGTWKLQHKYKFFNGHYDNTTDWCDVEVVFEKDLR